MSSSSTLIGSTLVVHMTKKMPSQQERPDLAGARATYTQGGGKLIHTGGSLAWP